MEVKTQSLGIGSRVKHPAYGDGVIIRLHAVAYEICFMTFGIKDVGRNYENLEIIDAIETQEVVSFSEAEASLIKILRNWSDVNEIVDLGDKWDKGKMILQPKDDSLKPKEIPIDSFFHKIVMVRDRVRVMEQRINSSNLSDEEKVNLQQYITRIYGSLTSFNILFKYKEDHFVGEKTK
ncbi:MAG: hypothetical protein ACI8VT_003017 [Saprospiraceae bacterium]|jgi:hypothetical protein